MIVSNLFFLNELEPMESYPDRSITSAHLPTRPDGKAMSEGLATGAHMSSACTISPTIHGGDRANDGLFLIIEMMKHITYSFLVSYKKGSCTHESGLPIGKSWRINS